MKKQHDKMFRAINAAIELSDWLAECIAEACWEASEMGAPLAETKGWKKLNESTGNGLLASYHNQFLEAVGRAI